MHLTEKTTNKSLLIKIKKSLLKKQKSKELDNSSTRNLKKSLNKSNEESSKFSLSSKSYLNADITPREMFSGLKRS